MKVRDTPNVSNTEFEKLGHTDIITVQDLLLTKHDQEITDDELESIKNKVRLNYVAPVWSGLEYFENVIYDRFMLNTISDNMDAVLNGGFILGDIIEILGESGCGKSQFCMMITANTALSGADVVFIDTSNGFSVNRITQICDSSQSFREDGVDIGDILRRIICYDAFDVFQMFYILEKLIDDIDKLDPELDNVKLIIIDSVASIFAPLLNSFEKSPHAYSYLQHLSRCLKKLSQKAIVICSNHTLADNETPALGSLWERVPTTRLKLINMDNGIHDAYVTYSNRLVEHSF